MAEYAQLSDFSGFLTPEQSSAIFEKAQQGSIVQQLGRQVTLGPSGKNIPVFAEDPTADWVAEGGAKHLTNGGVGLQNMQPQKIASIFVASAEAVRADPVNYMQSMRDKVANAFARAFDAAALHGESSPFEHSVGETSKTESLDSAESVYHGLNNGLMELVQDGHELTGFALDPVSEPILNQATDSTGRPLFIDSPITETNPTVRPGRILGRPAYIGKGIRNDSDNTVAFGGDWSQIAWGVVGGISYDVSDQTTLPVGEGGSMISLWQHNLVEVRAEAEYGLVVNEPEAFVKYTYTFGS